MSTVAGGLASMTVALPEPWKMHCCVSECGVRDVGQADATGCSPRCLARCWPCLRLTWQVFSAVGTENWNWEFVMTDFGCGNVSGGTS